MSEPYYEQLLDATIQHLQNLKGQGVRFLPVAAETLVALKSIEASPRAFRCGCATDIRGTPSLPSSP